VVEGQFLGGCEIDHHDAPLGNVRNGFPCCELVNVAVARLFWNSLKRKTHINTLGRPDLIAHSLGVKPIF